MGAALPTVTILGKACATLVMRPERTMSLRCELRMVGTNVFPLWPQIWVKSNVDVIVGSSTPAIDATKRATSSIPMVMALVGDPVADFAGFRVQQISRESQRVVVALGPVGWVIKHEQVFHLGIAHRTGRDDVDPSQSGARAAS
jgi:hypothetical protein